MPLPTIERPASTRPTGGGSDRARGAAALAGEGVVKGTAASGLGGLLRPRGAVWGYALGLSSSCGSAAAGVDLSTLVPDTAICGKPRGRRMSEKGGASSESARGCRRRLRRGAGTSSGGAKAADRHVGQDCRSLNHPRAQSSVSCNLLLHTGHCQAGSSARMSSMHTAHWATSSCNGSIRRPKLASSTSSSASASVGISTPSALQASQRVSRSCHFSAGSGRGRQPDKLHLRSELQLKSASAALRPSWGQASNCSERSLGPSTTCAAKSTTPASVSWRQPQRSKCRSRDPPQSSFSARSVRPAANASERLERCRSEEM